MAKASETPLEQFGRIFAEALDDTLHSMVKDIDGAKNPQDSMDFAFKSVFESLPEDERDLNIAQLAIQKFAHRLFLELGWSKRFSVIAKADDGSVVNLRELSPFFAQETANWAEAYSANGNLIGSLEEEERRIRSKAAAE